MPEMSIEEKDGAFNVVFVRCFRIKKSFIPKLFHPPVETLIVYQPAGHPSSSSLVFARPFGCLRFRRWRILSSSPFFFFLILISYFFFSRRSGSDAAAGPSAKHQPRITCGVLAGSGSVLVLASRMVAVQLERI